MTPEQAAWCSLRTILTDQSLDPRRVENVVGPGHPDVNYAGGDIELKAFGDWPARPDTPIHVPKYTGTQAGWLCRRWRAQGLSWLMVRVGGRVWFLFDGQTAYDVWKGLTQQEWHDRAALVFPGHVRGWAGFPARSDSHSYQSQLRAWLRYDFERMQPWTRARARRLKCFVDLNRYEAEDVAKELGWDPQRVLTAELGGGPDADVDTLLSYWES